MTSTDVKSVSTQRHKKLSPYTKPFRYGQDTNDETQSAPNALSHRERVPTTRKDIKPCVDQGTLTATY